MGIKSAGVIALGAIVASTLAPAIVSASSSGAAADPGKAAFAGCAACHATTPNTNRLGPTLHKIADRPIAGAANFKYSPALKGRSGSWNAKTLDAFLADPKGFAPGNRMAYPGVKDPAKRAALVRYLMSL